MKEFKYVIQDKLGIHARPAGMLVKKAGEFQSSITLECGAKKADARRIMAVMGMGAKQGQELIVKVEGKDEEDAAVQIEAFLKENL